MLKSIYVTSAWLVLLTSSIYSEITIAAEAHSAPTITIDHYEVNGNTLLDSQKITMTLSPFVGDKRHFADINAAREALQELYTDAGYTTVRVELPEQEISSGIVRLNVEEMALRKVIIFGNNHYDDENIRHSLSELIEGSVPNTAAISESLRLSNDNPGKQTTLLFRPNHKSNDVDAILRVIDEKPWKAFAALDNSGTDATEKIRLSVGYQHANMLNRDHVLTLRYVTSPERFDAVNIYGYGYRIPFYNGTGVLDLYGGESNVNLGTVQGLFDVSGEGSIYGTRYTQYLQKTSAYEHKIGIGIDHREYRNNIDYQGVPLGTDVTVHPISLHWDMAWSGGTTSIESNLSWIQNIPGGENGGDADFAATRVGADASYNFIRLGGSIIRRFDSGSYLQAGFNGQFLRGQALVPGEQFGAGGQSSVRGFEERAIMGDRGIRYGVELFSRNLANIGSHPNVKARVSAFFDGAHTQRLFLQPGEKSSERIGSVGLGLHIGDGKNLNAQLDYGYVTEGTDTTKYGEQRIHARITYVY